ncbi:MAG TPA: hypothetical protein VF712_03765 [Thermoleophilaceae bacterium]|jgi:hypothetical protein
MTAPPGGGPRVAPADVFVGRRELLDALIARLDQTRPEDADGCVTDTYGVWGIGKSRFLAHLGREAAAAFEDGIVLSHSATALEPMAAPGATPLPEPTLPIALQRFFRFLREVRGQAIEQSGGDEDVRELFTDFDLAAENVESELAMLAFHVDVDQSITDADIGPGAQVQTTTISLNADLAEFGGQVHRALVSGEFASALAELSLDRPILWSIDDFECIASRSIGRWLLDLIGSIERGLVVLSRPPWAEEPAITMKSQSLIREPLPPLSEPEVQEYAERCLPDQAVAPGIGAVARRFTDGHPGTLGLVAELLQQDPALAGDPARLEAQLAALPEDIDARRLELVERIVPASEREAVEACAVLRRFDADALAAVLEQAPEAAAAKVDVLRRHSFIGTETDPDTGGRVHRLHGFVRGGMEQRLRDGSPARHAELHARAARFYYRWITEYEEEEQAEATSAYGGWYRYEDRRWQRFTREWLHHQAIADRAPSEGAPAERQRQRARRRFARVFLDAFWWWGYYIDFPFCHGLIEDWHATQEDVDWVEDLRLVLERYPTGWHKAGDPGWPDVRTALLRVRDACGLDGRPNERWDADDRHTRALLELFLAHSRRYAAAPGDDERARAYAGAAGHYETALGLFRDNEDAWDVAWTLFERAELHVEHGDEAAALADWNECVKTMLADQLDDEELMANVHRVTADIEWRRGRIADAMAAHGRSLAHAYLFQNRPHAPDAYTIAFYQEAIARASERLAAAWTTPEREAAAKALAGCAPIVCRCGGDSIAAALAAPDERALLALLPRLPASGADSEFLDEWRDVEDAVAATADRDLQPV